MEKETVVLLHGNSGSSKDMLHFEEMLKNDFDVLNLDLPLHGKNQAPVKELSIVACKAYVEAVLLEQKKTDVSIIGYSDGANVAAELCGAPSLHIDRCFLISPNTHAKGMLFQWRFLFHFMRVILFPFRFVQSLENAYKRMGMMVDYEMDGSIQRNANSFHLYYAQKDMFTRQDQEKMEAMLRTKCSVIDNHSHLSIPHSSEIENEIKRIFK